MTTPLRLTPAAAGAPPDRVPLCPTCGSIVQVISCGNLAAHAAITPDLLIARGVWIAMREQGGRTFWIAFRIGDGPRSPLGYSDALRADGGGWEPMTDPTRAQPRHVPCLEHHYKTWHDAACAAWAASEGEGKR